MSLAVATRKRILNLPWTSQKFVLKDDSFCKNQFKVCHTKDAHTHADDKSSKSIVSGAYFLNNNINMEIYVSYGMVH